jgi:hypothetical protein
VRGFFPLHLNASWFQDADALIAAELKRLDRPENYPVTGFAWKAALQFRNAWNVPNCGLFHRSALRRHGVGGTAAFAPTAPQVHDPAPLQPRRTILHFVL